MHAFLVVKSPAAAARAVDAVKAGVQTLEDHPEAGRAVEPLNRGYREWPIAFSSSAYLVRYRIVRDGVVILAIRHGRESGFHPEKV